MIYKLLFTFVFLCSLCTGIINPAAVSASSSPALITEVQTGYIASDNTEYPKQEFIELANILDAPLDINGWRLEYLAAANDGSGGPTAILAELTGQITPNGHVLLHYHDYALQAAPGDIAFGHGSGAPTGMLAKSGGHVWLVDVSGQVIDCVAWGSAVATVGADCDKATGTAGADQTVQRPLTEHGSYDKSLGVQIMSPPTPLGGGLWAASEPDPSDEPSVPLPPIMPCTGVELSEVLPNPAGSDAQGEFIELYNTNDRAVSLFGCSLSISSNGRSFAFPHEVIMEPHEYRAFGYSMTNLQLINEGGEVVLNGAEYQTSLTYPASADDQVWALIDDKWQTTFLPTPNAPNILQLPSDSGKGAKAVATVANTGLETCPVGKFRNPETNRCKNIETAETTLAPCAADQERNPETNRCRKATSATSTLTPCAPGQERNPATNRCRSAAAASTGSLKPCAPGQERNPETNRCRKVAGASTSSSNTNVSTKKANQNYKILIVVLALVAGYAVYEYRQDIKGGFGRIKRSLSRNGSVK